jgi:tetratricopeptide (TPR) repeat protein
MLDYNSFENFFNEESDESYPDFFFEWDDTVRSGGKPRFYESEELTEIIEIYIMNDQTKQAKQAIKHALSVHSGDEELLYDIFLILNDYEMWNDLLSLCKQYQDNDEVWIYGHKLTALLHLGMEEEAFFFFSELKTKYASDNEDLNIIYQAMGESLLEVDLFDSCIEVIQEVIHVIGKNEDLTWLLLQGYVSLNDSEKVIAIAEGIQKENPLNAGSWHRLGIAFQEIGDFERAIDAYEFAQSLGYDFRQNMMKLIFAYENNGNFLKALEKAGEYLNLYPDSCLVNMIAAKICSETENWTEAIRFINAAIQLIPEMDSLYLYKSGFLLNLEEYRKAKQALLEGIKITSDPTGDLKRELSKLEEQFPSH